MSRTDLSSRVNLPDRVSTPQRTFPGGGGGGTSGEYLSASISYSDAQNEWSNIGADSNALVIQQEPRHYGMYEWLKTLTVSDVAVNSLGDPTYTPGSGASNDEIYKSWVSFRNSQGERPSPRLLRFPDEDFVLDDGNGNGFEADPNTGVRISLEDNQTRKAVSACAAWWTDFDIPGIDNPYYDNNNAKRKIMAQACVDLMELERYIRGTTVGHAGTNLVGMVIRDNVQAVAHAGGVLPDQVKYALIEQAQWAFDQVQGSWRWPWINENMSSKAMCGLVVCWRLLDDLSMDTSQKDNIMSIVKNALYDDNSSSSTPNDDAYGRHTSTLDGTTDNQVKGLTRPDGGWIENGGAHGTYNGIPMHYLLEGYGYVKGLAEWDFFKEMARRFFVRGADEAMRDYDNMVAAPSAYSNRELTPITSDQSPNAGKYALATQFFGQDAYPWFGSIREGNSSNCIPPSVSDMESTIQSNVNMNTSEMASNLRDWALESRWGPRHGGIAFYHYEDGLYDEINNAVSNNNSNLNLPMERSGNSFTKIKSDFLLHKGSSDGKEWGCNVEMALWPGIWTQGMQNINAFWVEGAGPIIQNIAPDYDKYNAPSRPMPDLRVELSDGSNIKLASYENGDSAPVDSRNSGADFIEQQFTKNGVVNNTRADVLSNGLQMTNEVTPDASSFEWTDSWYRLPIFRGLGGYTWSEDTNSDSVFNEFEGPRTLIEYWDGSAWQTLTTTKVSSQYIRLSRDLEPSTNTDTRVYSHLVLNSSRSVYLGQTSDYSQKNPWNLSSFRHRDLHIDIHPNPGTAETLSGTASMVYTLQTTDPTV